MAQGETAAPVLAELETSGPFDGGSVLDFLGRRAVAGIERVDEQSYARTVGLAGGPATLEAEVLDAGVRARLWLTDPRDLDEALQRVRRIFDLDADLEKVSRVLAADPRLAASVAAHPGLRVPGHVDGFEVGLRAIVGQQISVVGARTILARIVAEHGTPVAGHHDLTLLFPSADTIAAADPASFPMPRSRGRAIVGLAHAVATGVVRLDRSAERSEVRRSLLALPGIGPWTADYIALRALGDPDVFLPTDLGVRHGLARLGISDLGPSVADSWRPWRSYALMHVWKALEEDSA
jgi:AraC family transcriptional regulator of adaptative response / DNA-3-methyladenine glycosylase II